MRSSASMMLLLLLIVLTSGSVGCGSVEKKPSEKPSLPKGEALTILDEDCQPIVGLPQWVCYHEEERYVRLGTIVIKLEGQVTDLSKENIYLRDKWDIREQRYEVKLDQWHRKWYIVAPPTALIFLLLGMFLL